MRYEVGDRESNGTVCPMTESRYSRFNKFAKSSEKPEGITSPTRSSRAPSSELTHLEAATHRVWLVLSKVCSRCKERKILLEFPASKGRHSGGRMAWCKICTRDYAWRRRWAIKLGVSIDVMDTYLERASRQERREL
jgi:hypothetical protein